MTALSRRTLLLAGLGGVAAFALGACNGDGDGDDGDDGGGSGSSGGFDPVGKVVAAQFFLDGTQVAGVPQRFAFGLGDEKGLVEGRASPSALVATVLDLDGNQVLEPVTVPRHVEDLERPYWPLRTQLPAGVYQVAFEYDGNPVEPAAFTVSEVGATMVPQVGSPLLPTVTPTTADPAGVNPICTRKPACPFHQVSLDEALKAGKPVAYLVGTPAYCQTGICGPVLDILIDVAPAYGDDLTVIHAEVWTDDTVKVPAPAVQAHGLEFEPVLFLVGADGVVRDRLDIIFDRAELEAGLDALTA